MSITNEKPLAARFRPETLDEIIGQEHIIGPDKMLSRLIKADNFGCLIFYGPPGTGKTTIGTNVLTYYGTSVYSTAEMALVLDEVLTECKNLNSSTIVEGYKGE